MVYEENFRLDLYYRIAPTIISLEPLRSRTEDIEPIIQSYLEKEGKKNEKNLYIDNQTMQALIKYPWPGNIRELTNSLAAASILCESDHISINDFPRVIQYSKNAGYVEPIYSLKETVRSAEKEAIHRALIKFGTSTEGKTAAAKALGISIATLYNKLSYFDI